MKDAQQQKKIKNKKVYKPSVGTVHFLTPADGLCISQSLTILDMTGMNNRQAPQLWISTEVKWLIFLFAE